MEGTVCSAGISSARGTLWRYGTMVVETSTAFCYFLAKDCSGFCWGRGGYSVSSALWKRFPDLRILSYGRSTSLDLFLSWLEDQRAYPQAAPALASISMSMSQRIFFIAFKVPAQFQFLHCSLHV
jgi:hypothetical protein